MSVDLESKTQPVGRRGRRRGRETSALFNPVGSPPLIRVLPNTGLYTITQLSTGSVITSSTVAATFSAVNFQFAQLDQASTLAALFDQYRIDWIEVWLSPRLAAPQATSANFGQFVTVVDYDDSVALSIFASALDYSNALIAAGNLGHYRRFKPHVALAAYSGAFTSYANVASPWLDAVSTGVQHYGLKTAWTTTDTAYTFDAVFRFTVTLRNVR